MTLAPAALAVLLASGPEVRAVRVTTIDARTALRVLTSDDAPGGIAARQGEEVVIRLPARLPEGLPLPATQKPIEGLRLEQGKAGTVLRVKIAPEVPFQLMNEPGLLTIVFGVQPAAELGAAVTPELYARLFPTGTAGASAEGQASVRPESGREGWGIGRVALRPYLNASWVDADITAFDDPQPVRAHYLQVGPGITASAPLFGAMLAAEYEPRLRFFSNLPQAEETSHVAGVKLEAPLGTRTLLRLGHRFARATLETTIVDPGREYFYDLSRYTFNDTTLGARVELGPRLFAEGEAGARRTRFDQADAGFFDYDSRAVRAGIGYDLGGSLRTLVSYTFERVPPSEERPVVETSAHALTGTLSGEIGPLMTGSLSAGYRTQTSPHATGDSRSFRGFVVGGSLQRALGHAASLGLTLNRSAQLSAFETNAYYVDNSATLSLSVPLPFEISGNGSAIWLRNDYPNDASAIGTPRRDRILAWTLGVGRRVGARAYVRADFRRERRDSNLPGFDVTTDGFVIQLGLGLAPTTSGARP